MKANLAPLMIRLGSGDGCGPAQNKALRRDGIESGGKRGEVSEGRGQIGVAAAQFLAQSAVHPEPVQDGD
jgi:hypothetical protein